jgi:hypothetical protein
MSRDDKDNALIRHTICSIIKYHLEREYHNRIVIVLKRVCKQRNHSSYLAAKAVLGGYMDANNTKSCSDQKTKSKSQL